jgi:Family of unknown function (DUF6527)
MKGRFCGIGIGSGDDLEQPGDFGFGAENYHFNFMVCCPVCHDLHLASVAVGRWKWEQATMTLSPSVKVTSYRGVCHWNLTNGEFIIHGDSTAKPREGKSDG